MVGLPRTRNGRALPELYPQGLHAGYLARGVFDMIPCRVRLLRRLLTGNTDDKHLDLRFRRFWLATMRLPSASRRFTGLIPRDDASSEWIGRVPIRRDPRGGFTSKWPIEHGRVPPRATPRNAAREGKFSRLVTLGPQGPLWGCFGLTGG